MLVTALQAAMDYNNGVIKIFKKIKEYLKNLNFLYKN